MLIVKLGVDGDKHVEVRAGIPVEPLTGVLLVTVGAVEITVDDGMEETVDGTTAIVDETGASIEGVVPVVGIGEAVATATAGVTMD